MSTIEQNATEITKNDIMNRLFTVYKNSIQFTSEYKYLERQFHLKNIGLTSLSMLIMIMGIEKEFQIFINLEYLLEQIRIKENNNDVNMGYTVGDLVDYIYALIWEK
jgi:acyl carrier protein